MRRRHKSFLFEGHVTRFSQTFCMLVWKFYQVFVRFVFKKWCPFYCCSLEFYEIFVFFYLFICYYVSEEWKKKRLLFELMYYYYVHGPIISNENEINNNNTYIKNKDSNEQHFFIYKIIRYKFYEFCVSRLRVRCMIC